MKKYFCRECGKTTKKGIRYCNVCKEKYGLLINIGGEMKRIKFPIKEVKNEIRRLQIEKNRVEMKLYALNQYYNKLKNETHNNKV